MTLSSALNTATNSLQATQTQTALVSRNIANANAPGATRKYANVVTGPEGRVEVRSVAQSQNNALFRNVLNGTSDVAKSGVVAGGLDRLSEVIGDTDAKGSPAALVSALTDALQTYSASPSNHEMGMTAVGAAQKIVTSLNTVSATVDEIRRDADNELALAADDMNKILAEIETLNRRITSGTAGNHDVTDEVDQRDAAIQKLSQYVGINVLTRGDNDVVISTDSGVTLFDRTPRSVEFAKTYPLAAGQVGNAFRIDGTVVTGDNAYMPLSSGKVAGLVELRDKTTTKFQGQLDEIARSLITVFSETNSANPSDVKQGAFQATDAITAGVAGRFKLAEAVLKDPTLLRDGGINDNDANTATPSTFKSNTSNAAGYTSRLNALISDLNKSDRTFLSPDLDKKASLASFAASSMSWLQGMRSSVSATNDYQTTLLTKTQETLSNETGIDLNSELTQLLDLQRSFQASSKIISTVDEMMAALLQSI